MILRTFVPIGRTLRSAAGLDARSQVLVLLAGVFCILSLITTTGCAPNERELELIERINESRERVGLRALRVDERLVQVARRNSEEMVRTGSEEHTEKLLEALAAEQYQASRASEQAGIYSGTVMGAHETFLASEANKAKLLVGWAREIGVGIIVHQGQLYITQILARPTAADGPAQRAADTEVAPGAS
jgi:uncharacterized protein YkwD